MDFIDQIRALGTTVGRLKDTVQTEEATKQAFILPFLNAMGYNVFDPTEVVPEMCADIGIKKGEKVDYAIIKDGKPIILIEAKHASVNLDTITPTQLYRYFSVTNARVGVLTNGVLYRFFSDLEEPNKMDVKPFLEVNLLDIQEPMVAELKRMSKTQFQLDEVVSAAVELKYTKEIKRVLAEEMAAPSEEFVRLFTGRVYTGRMTPTVRQQFTDLVKRALHLFISERLSDRLKSALAQESGEVVLAQELSVPPVPDSRTGSPETKKSGIVTTALELEAYYLIKGLLRDVVAPSRLAYRDAASYFSILLDNNNRRTVCRLYLEGQRRYIGFLNEERKEERVSIGELNDLFNHAERLRTVIANLEQRIKSGAEQAGLDLSGEALEPDEAQTAELVPPP